MITIIDYGMGNIGSILNMYKHIGIKDVCLSNSPNQIKQAQKLILPGVGAFDTGMQNLKRNGIIDYINEKVLIEKIPVLGICLGMQLLGKGSDEGNEEGLGWIAASCMKFRFRDKSLKIPHMGWNYTKVCKPNSLIEEQAKNRFYFVHSYFMKCEHEEDTFLSAKYGHEFTCGVQKDNIYGVQFHPEKSHKFGMEILKNFSDL